MAAVRSASRSARRTLGHLAALALGLALIEIPDAQRAATADATSPWRPPSAVDRRPARVELYARPRAAERWPAASPVQTGGGQDVGAPLRQTFRTGVDLTSVTVTVVDSEGRLVRGLDRERFEIFEDVAPQVVTQFVGDRVPVSLGVLLDTSDSMFGERIREARHAIDRFLFELLDRRDEFSILAFNHVPRLVTGWTADPLVVRPALDQLRPSGATAAYDAVLAALPLFESRHRQRAALLIISDGADTASDASAREVRAALLRSDAFVYAVAIDADARQPINSRVNPQALREITDPSGGRTEIVRSTADLFEATTRIAEELSSQYLLGYTSSHGADGQYHSIRVRVTGGDYRVRARRGYVAPDGSRPCATPRAPCR